MIRRKFAPDVNEMEKGAEEAKKVSIRRFVAEATGAGEALWATPGKPGVYLCTMSCNCRSS